MRRCLFIKGAAAVSLAQMLTFSAFAEEKMVSSLAEYESKMTDLLNKLSFENIASSLLKQVPEALKSFGSSLFFCLCLTVVCFAVSLLKGDGDGEGFKIISSCLLIISVCYPLSVCVSTAQSCLSELCAYMISLIPTSALLLSYGGNTAVAAVAISSTGPLTLLQFITVSVLLPTVCAMITLRCFSLLCKRIDLSGPTQLLKSFSSWAIGLSFTLFSGLLSLKAMLASGADSLAIKGIKFGASRFIPIAGSIVSESVKTVLATASFIKTVSGMGVIIYIIYAILPSVIIILSAKLMLWLISYISQLFGISEFREFLSGLCDALNLLMALIIGCGISLVLLLGVFIKTSVQV